MCLERAHSRCNVYITPWSCRRHPSGILPMSRRARDVHSSAMGCIAQVEASWHFRIRGGRASLRRHPRVNPNFVSGATFIRLLAFGTTSIASRIRVTPPSGESCHLVRRGSSRISRPFWALVGSSSVKAEIRSDIADEATVSEAILPELESQTHQVRLQSHLQVGVWVPLLVLGRRRCMCPAMSEHPA